MLDTSRSGADELEAGRSVSLTIPAKAEYLVFCRLVLTGISRAREIDPETVADLKLAVTEACSNSIRHAYGDERDGPIAVRYELDEERLAIDVVDRGLGFEPPEARSDPLELSEDGMGIAIIRAVVDELEVGPGPSGSGNRVRFTKYLD